MHNENWLRNRLPSSSRINGRTKLLKWDPQNTIKFKNHPYLGQHGYLFIYQPNDAAKKKLLPRSKFLCFIGV